MKMMSYKQLPSSSSAPLQKTQNLVATKRKRTHFSRHQVSVLEQNFYEKPYMNRVQRFQLAQELNLDEKAVKIWFQNRRLKNKRSPSCVLGGPSSSKSSEGSDGVFKIPSTPMSCQPAVPEECSHLDGEHHHLFYQMVGTKQMMMGNTAPTMQPVNQEANPRSWHDQGTRRRTV